MRRREAYHINPKRWAAVRLVVFARDLHRCRLCGAAGRLECDHRIPLYRGGSVWDLANLQALCRQCHLAKTRRDRRGGPEHPSILAWRRFMADTASS